MDLQAIGMMKRAPGHEGASLLYSARLAEFSQQAHTPEIGIHGDRTSRPPVELTGPARHAGRRQERGKGGEDACRAAAPVQERARLEPVHLPAAGGQ